ncbi:MAG: zeta toxin family protein [Acidobacteriota bacterium]
MTPQLVMLAGPNGAGKSTYYDAFLGDSPLPFLNADLFAAETGVDSLEAARVLDATRDRMIDDRLGFITETVFSDPYGEKLAMLRNAVDAGYDVTLVYIGIANAELASRRVDQRLAHGGHDVPRDRLASRYERSLANLKRAIELVPTVELFDNSFVDEPYRHVASFEQGTPVHRAVGILPAWCRGLVPSRRRRR